MKRRDDLILTHAETDRLKDVCDTFSDQLIVYGILYLGVRVDELCHLKPTWINEYGTEVTIPKQDGDWHPKTSAYVKDGIKNVIHVSNRSIPVLNPTLTTILLKMRETGYTLNMTRTEVWKRLNQLWIKTGFEGSISPHMLRHTALSRMAHAGHTIDDLQGQAGHSDGSWTWKTYIHSDNVELKRNVQKLGGIK